MEEKVQKGEMLPLSKGPQTVAEAAEIWLKSYQYSGRASLGRTGPPTRPFSTWHKAKVQTLTYILPRLGADLRISALSKKDLQGVLDKMGEQGYKPGSIKTTVSVMKSLFRDLEILEITPTNYAKEISGNWTTTLEKSEESLKIPTQKEIIALGRALEKSWPGHGPIVYALAYSGLRFEEIAALRWEDLDLDKAIIKVRRTATESGGRRFLSDDLKSRSSRRNVILLKAARGSFGKLNLTRLENQKRYPDKDWDRLLNGARGGYISYKTWQRHLLKARNETGIDITAHDLRHTFASMLFAAGESIQLISEQLGHSSIRITEKTYIHLIERPRLVDAERINLKLFG